VKATAPAPGAPPSLRWLAALREPQQVLHWSLAEWQAVVPQARRLRLLARLAEAVDAAGLHAQLPPQPLRHLLAEQQLSRHRTTAMTWAIARTGAALAGAGYPRVLIKGAAYLAQRLPIAAGRMPSDLDILVPRAHLADAQLRLQAQGWAEVELDAHDRRYYHEWSHEVPPMRHPIHAIELDLHHNILPPLARTAVDAQALLARLQPAPACPGWSVLQPADQVLHCAAHLGLDAELRERVRDLVDLDGLLRHHAAADPGFWPALLARARTLGLGEPLALALPLCAAWLDSPVPPDVASELADAGPGRLGRRVLAPLLRTLLSPSDPLHDTPAAQRAAAAVFLARYHLQRLPLRLLLPHLWHKLRRD
jgi:hypothetical protein